MRNRSGPTIVAIYVHKLMHGEAKPTQLIMPVAFGAIFIGMGVVEREGAGFVERRCVLHRPGASQQQHGCEAGVTAGFRERQRVELACETRQHV